MPIRSRLPTVPLGVEMALAGVQLRADKQPVNAPVLMKLVVRAALRTGYGRKLCLRGGLCDGEVDVLVSTFAGFVSFQNAAWINAQLLHSRDECGAF